MIGKSKIKGQLEEVFGANCNHAWASQGVDATENMAKIHQID